MKAKSLLISIQLCLLIVTVSYSQITIGKFVKQKDTVVEKPIPYDSLKNFEISEKHVNLKQYIGLQVYLPQNDDSFLPNLFSKTYISSKNLVNKYYTIIDVFYKDVNPDPIMAPNTILKYYIYSDSLYKFLKDMFLNKFIYPTKRKDRDQFPFMKRHKDFSTTLYSNEDNWTPDITFMLRSNDTNDTLLWTENGSMSSGEYYDDYFILVPYFVKQKQLYQNKTLVFKGGYLLSYDFVSSLDIITDKVVERYQNSKWFCSEVTLLKLNGLIVGNPALGYDTSAYRLNYVLKNELGETIAVPSLLDEQNDQKFITIAENNKLEFEKKLKKEDLIAKNQQEEKIRKAKEIQSQAKYKALCINKFGAYYGDLISQGKVKIGMSTDMCKAAWGTPYNTFKTTNYNGEYEDWYYGWKYSLSFKDGILIEINN